MEKGFTDMMSNLNSATHKNMEQGHQLFLQIHKQGAHAMKEWVNTYVGIVEEGSTQFHGFVKEGMNLWNQEATRMAKTVRNASQPQANGKK